MSNSKQLKSIVITKKGLRWNPPGKRKHGRPKMTLRKPFEEDFKKIELTWRMAEREAKEREWLNYPQWLEER